MCQTLVRRYISVYLFLWESACSGFLAYPSLIHLSSIAALTLGLLAGSGSRRDNTNAAAPESGDGMKQCFLTFRVWIQWFLPFGFSLFQPIVLVLWLATLPFCFSLLSKLKNPTDCLTVCPEPNSRWMCRWTQRSVLKRRSQIFLSRAKRRFARVREAWKSIFAGLKSFNHKSNITCVTPHSLYSELEQQLLCFMN